MEAPTGSLKRCTAGPEKTVGQPCQPPQPSRLEASGGPFRHAAVATDNLLCSKVGTYILKKGGHAVDAAIATALCVGVANPQSSGIGGGGIMVIYEKTEHSSGEVIDFRETAPASSSENMFKGKQNLATKGGLAVAIPGVVRGFEEAHQKYGKLPWGDLFQPAIQMAEEGFCIASLLAAQINREKSHILEERNHLCEVFCDENNDILTENTLMKRPQLAKTLRAVADGGADAFYTGEVARNLVKDIQDAGGIITEQDLLDYRVEVTSPLNISLTGGLTVLSPPAPSSGPVLSLILRILDGYKFNPSSVQGVDNQILTYHRVLEAFKFAFAKRTELGDPTFVDIDEFVRDITSAEFAESLRLRISDSTTHDYRYYGPSFVLPEHAGTSQVCILAPNGDAVSLTCSVNLEFGAKFRSPSTGIILNNQMDDFSSPNLNNFFGLPPSPANFIRPGKRPVSSMAPCIVLDSNNDVRLVIGSSGGTKIITATAYVMMQHLWFGLDLVSAVEKPRLHHQLIPDRVVTELVRPFDPEAVIEGLRQKNHVISLNKERYAAVIGVAKKDGVISAASDSRRKGHASGF